jgi:hypothetical protein
MKEVAQFEDQVKDSLAELLYDISDEIAFLSKINR